MSITVGKLSDDLELFIRCKYYLSVAPPQVPDADFVQRLMTAFVEKCPQQQGFSGKDIAALVDHLAANSSSINLAVELLAKLTGRSTEAIAKSHTRYGKTHNKINLERKSASSEDLESIQNPVMRAALTLLTSGKIGPSLVPMLMMALNDPQSLEKAIQEASLQQGGLTREKDTF